MNDTKSPFASIGIMGPIISLLVVVLNRWKPGLGLTDADVTGVVDAIGACVATLTAVYGRWRATTKIALKLVPLLLLATALTACAGNARVTATESLVAACIAYKDGLNILADLNRAGRLDAKAVTTVGRVVAAVHPICMAPTPPVDTAGALAVLNAELPTLQALLPRS